MAQPWIWTPSSSWPNGGQGPDTHLVLTECVEGTDLQDIEGALHLEGWRCSVPGKGKGLVPGVGGSRQGVLPLLSPTHLGRDFKGEEMEAPGGQSLQKRM
jgi:hypothetical protein